MKNGADFNFSSNGSLIDFFDSRSGASSSVVRGSAVTTASSFRGSTSRLLVHLGDDGTADGLYLFQLILELVGICGLVGIEPAYGLLALVEDLLAVALVQLALDVIVLDSGLHVEAVRLQAVLCGDAVFLLFVLFLVFLSLGDHSLDVVLGETALVVGDGDLFLLAGRLVDGRNVEDAIGVDVEGDLDLWNATRSWRNAGQIELAEQVVVPGHGSFTLINL